MMKKFTKVLATLVILTGIISISITFYHTVIKRDYIVIEPSE